MAARIINNIKEDYLICAICFNGYVDPRELPCGHTFCLECLEIHINENNRIYGFDCPCCRRRIRLARSGNVASVAASFPSNYFLKDIVNRVKLHESGSPSCNKHTERPAEYFCLTDNVLLCPDCGILMHRKAVCDVIRVADAHTILKPECDKMRTRYAEKTAQLRNMLTDHFKDNLIEEIKNKTLDDINRVEQNLGEFYDHTIQSIRHLKEELRNPENILPIKYDSKINQIISDLVNAKQSLDNLDEGSNWLVQFQQFKKERKLFINNIDETIKQFSGTIFSENPDNTVLLKARVPVGTIKRQHFTKVRPLGEFVIPRRTRSSQERQLPRPYMQIGEMSFDRSGSYSPILEWNQF